MLEQIREHTKGWFAWLVIITIAIVFALWGVYGYMGVTSAESQVAVTVDGHDIPRAAVDRLAMQLQQNASPNGENPSVESLRAQAENQLIMQTLLLEDAINRGFMASKPLVDKLMLTQPEFQENGAFSPALFEQTAARIGYTPLQLRQLFGDEIVVEQLRAGIIDSTFVTESDVNQFLALQEQTRDIQYITFPLKQFIPTNEISADQIENYYQKNIARWQIPEQVSVDYIRLTKTDIAKNIQIPEVDIENTYENNKAAYTVPEQREVAHILIALPVNPDPEQVEKATAQAEEIKSKLMNAGDFSGLAKAFSNDTASAANDGNLGWLNKGVLAPELDEVVFTAQPHTIIGPIRTDFGIHIAQVIAVKPASTLPLKEVHDQIAGQLLEQKTNQQFIALQDEMSTLSYETHDSLKETSDALKQPIQTSTLFTRTNGTDDLSQIQAVREAAFSADVLAGDNSQVLTLNENEIMVLRIHDHIPASTKPLTNVQAEVVNAVKNDEAQQALRKNVDDWLTQLKEGKITSADVAKQVNAQWKSVSKLTRGADETMAPAAIRDYAFTLPRPLNADKPSYGWVAINPNEFALVSVSNVQAGQALPNTSQEWQQAQKLLIMLQEQSDYGYYLDQLRANASIKKHG